MATKTVSLSEFAAGQPNPNAKCRLCALGDDVRGQVAVGINGGVAATVATRWLEAAHAVKISPEAVRRCCRAHGA